MTERPSDPQRADKEQRALKYVVDRQLDALEKAHVALTSGTGYDPAKYSSTYSEAAALIRRLHDLCARSAGTRIATVSADSHDELPAMVCIVRASGEGVTDWKLCRNEAEIRTAYVEMVCGSDDEHHKEEIDGIMEGFRSGEGWHGDTLKIDLYCASFTITRFPADCLGTPQSASEASPCPCTPADRVECHNTPDPNRPTNCVLNNPSDRKAHP